MPKPKAKVRHVKFTPEEMAYDPSPEELGKWVFVGRGPDATFLKPSDARLARLDPDIAVYFREDRLVNEILRRAMGIMKAAGRAKRKTA